MELQDIQDLWKSHDKKLNHNLVINSQSMEVITKSKFKSLLASLVWIKVFTIMVGIVWVGGGTIILSNLYLYAFEYVSLFFLLSASIQLFLTGSAIILYLYQLVLIYKVDSTQPILDTQKKLTNLKSSTLWIARILVLQLPVWTTFYLHKSMFVSSNFPLILVQLIVTLSFTFIALWLFKNITYENKGKRWFKVLFFGKEWTSVLDSITLYKEIEEFKRVESD